MIDKTIRYLLSGITAAHEAECNIKPMEAEARKLLLQLSKDELVDAIFAVIERHCAAHNATREQVITVAITEFGMHPHQAEKINLPSLTGALMAFSLPEVDESKVCNTCAFRKDTPANLTFTTTSDAVNCLTDGNIFMCHEQFDSQGEPLHACRGFAQAKRS